MFKKMSLAAAVLAGTAAMSAHAGVVPYPAGGTPAPENVFVAAADGNITAYFFSTDAGYSSEIGLWVNGVSTGIYGLPNHSSSHGQSLVLGNVHAGDLLEFELKVINTGSSWFSASAHNSDGFNHAYSTDFAGDADIPAGTYVGFEDLPSPSDFDYNDHQFVFTNVKKTSQVPEPAGLGLLGLGLAMLGWARKKAAK